PWPPSLCRHSRRQSSPGSAPPGGRARTTAPKSPQLPAWSTSRPIPRRRRRLHALADSSFISLTGLSGLTPHFSRRGAERLGFVNFKLDLECGGFLEHG